ncbi:MAG: hypothetical protein COU30_05600 [Candidatus Magasanikbacteria bacterium CG10_big_fil_rev_8_21_14_0_10_38_6]|uniref:CDP-alcohol phosphatidyltransferase family protein n=1 Tax=Candidatus Magasanikbacteria bacterium CG10_big_fil_rev_8_21_14_0_10_38_6 TaxID=1974647 RepID=A0A2M6NZI0_9BACT|nr:MAG: hypothetical protein COU30_05600 [Candidatus Magasanikbacteria bacterium CG10_big_fil_rev_8_21_14_0_10_38_6]
MKKNYSIKELRAICQKTAPDPKRESWVGLFSRIFSIYCTKIFLKTAITPNNITILSVVTFFIGIGMFFFDTTFMNILGSLIIFLSIVFDGCDGEVARFREQKSLLGGVYTEPVSHDVQYGFAPFILGVALYVQGYGVIFLLCGAIASITKLEYRLLDARILQLQQLIEQKKNDAVFGESIPVIVSRSFASTIYVIMARVNKNFLSSTGVFFVLFVCSLFHIVDYGVMFFAIGYMFFYVSLFLKHFYLIYSQKLYNK